MVTKLDLAICCCFTRWSLDEWMKLPVSCYMYGQLYASKSGDLGIFLYLSLNCILDVMINHCSNLHLEGSIYCCLFCGRAYAFCCMKLHFK
uniref:Uncharacterized protein n=1 Tax=Pyxicephalus adspersus TaxID=30357 RepID=A0AAV3ABK7_PYXAD|nr:TPA: hypothetical protein GDO54_011953 [Pyxicephalus adspersus]